MLNLNNAIYEVNRNKTDIKGLWKDENGKVYIDNISLYNPVNAFDFEGKVSFLYAKGEKCIFVRGTDESYILYPDGQKITLTKKILFYRDKLSFNEIKKLLSVYGGLTIFKITGQYVIEIWKG